MALTSRPMPVAELPPSNPGVFVDVSIVLPLTIGALSSAWAPGITAVAVPSMSVTLWPKSDTAAAPISATPATISAYSTSAAPVSFRRNRCTTLDITPSLFPI